MNPSSLSYWPEMYVDIAYDPTSVSNDYVIKGGLDDVEGRGGRYDKLL